MSALSIRRVISLSLNVKELEKKGNAKLEERAQWRAFCKSNQNSKNSFARSFDLDRLPLLARPRPSEEEEEQAAEERGFLSLSPISLVSCLGRF